MLSSHDSIITLWPEGLPATVREDAPAARGPLGDERAFSGWIENVSTPTLTVLSPVVDRANGAAVIVCPGGGYAGLSHAREGVQYAHWLSFLGITPFILKYRLKEYGHPAPLQDVLRAIRVVRSRAANFKIDPARLGVMGSSAGGHLAASAGTLFDHPDGRTGANLDAVNARPDFLILMYPVISMADGLCHEASRENLLGVRRSHAALALASLENQVTSSTPPTLVIHTQPDEAVPVENSLRFYQALTRARVPAELHVFEQGVHGIGLCGGLGNASQWTELAEKWLRARRLLEPAGAAPNP